MKERKTDYPLKVKEKHLVLPRKTQWNEWAKTIILFYNSDIATACL